MKKETGRDLVAATLFGVALGIMEAAVLSFIRALYWPESWHAPHFSYFPIREFNPQLLNIEHWREYATLATLLAVALISDKNHWRKLAWGLYTFSVYMVFYFTFLKVFVDYPDSLMRVDLLITVPDYASGPILSAVLGSVVQIVIALGMLVQMDRGWRPHLHWPLIITFLLGNALAMGSYYEYSDVIASGGIPGPYNWWQWIAGEIIYAGSFLWWIFIYADQTPGMMGYAWKPNPKWKG